MTTCKFHKKGHLYPGGLIRAVVETNRVSDFRAQDAVSLVGDATRQGSRRNASGFRDSDHFSVRSPSCFHQILQGNINFFVYLLDCWHRCWSLKKKSHYSMSNFSFYYVDSRTLFKKQKNE